MLIEDNSRKLAFGLVCFAAMAASTAFAYIQYMLSYYEQLFNDAMASEAATTVTEAN